MLGGVHFGEDAAGSGAAAGGRVEQHGFLDPGEVAEELAEAERQSGAVGLAAHQVGDGEASTQ